MTPEERARQVLSDAGLLAWDFQVRLIADVVREAVLDERELCARLAERVAQEFSQHNSDHQIAAYESLACRIVARRIREQEDT